MRKDYLVIALALVVVAALAVWAVRRGDEKTPAPVPPGSSVEDGVSREPPVAEIPGEAIMVRHRYINGTHTYSGTLTTPTPCHSVSADARVMESYPEQVVLALTLREPERGVVCVQVIAEQPFSVRVGASAEATVKGELNGVPVMLTVEESDVDTKIPTLGVELIP